MIRWAIAAGAAMVLATAGVTVVSRQYEIVFEHVQEAQERLARAGFHCRSDRADGSIGSGFLISKEALSWIDVGSLRKVGPMGPDWKGKVWITINRPEWRQESLPDNAGLRCWGSVIAYGDEALLQEVDAALAPLPLPSL